jgi:hypothetical protein
MTDTATECGRYMSLERGHRSWKLTIGDGRRGPSRCGVDAGDTAAALDRLAKVRPSGLRKGVTRIRARRLAATIAGCTGG